MVWTRRLLRCAMLRTPPGEDILSPVAHTLCHFWTWFNSKRDQLDALDAQAAERIEAVHEAMHDSIRELCTSLLAGQPWQASDLALFEQSQSELLALLAQFKTLVLSRVMMNDPLTGLPLRYGIESEFSKFQKNARRTHSLLFIVMIDVDHFKAINDSYGHPTGDLVLRHLADTLKRALRGNEPLYRFGGEEFLLLMQCHAAGEAEQTAQRLVETIRATPFPIAEGQSLTLTITVGLAQVGEQEGLPSAIKRSDLAMYEGKKSGRDRYVITRI